MKLLISALFLALLSFTVAQDNYDLVSWSGGSWADSLENLEAEANFYTTEGGYSPVDWTVASENAETVDLLNFGVQYAVDEGIEEGILADSEFFVTEVYSLDTQILDGINYDFDVAISNGQGETANLDVIVYDEPLEDITQVIDFTFSDIADFLPILRV